MNWFTPDEAPTTPIGDALRQHVDQNTRCRAQADAGDKAAQARLDARDLGERAAAALRDQNPPA